MRCMLLGYSLEPSPKSRALGTAGSFMTIGLSIMAHTRKTGLTRPEVLALKAIQAKPHFLFLDQEDRSRLYS